MSLRAGENLAEQVAELQKANEELKTAQFTSQNSGMKFKQAESLNGVLDIPVSVQYSEKVFIITNTFIPEHKKPAISVANIEYNFNAIHYRTEIYRDYERNYITVSFYDSNDNYIGYFDAEQFFHQGATAEGYCWKTVVFAQSDVAMDIPFTISLRATDSGTHSLNIESWIL